MLPFVFVILSHFRLFSSFQHSVTQTILQNTHWVVGYQWSLILTGLTEDTGAVCHSSASSSESTLGTLGDLHPQITIFIMFIKNISLHLKLGQQWGLHICLNVSLCNEQVMNKSHSCSATASASSVHSLNWPVLISGEVSSLLGDPVVPADDPVVPLKETQCHD